MSKIILFLLLTSYCLCSGYKFLLVFPIPSLSHSVLGEGYVRNLLNAGHEVTYITSYPIKNATKALRQLVVADNTNIFLEDASNKTVLSNKNDMQDIGTVLDVMLKIANATVMHVNVQKLLNDAEEQFDAVVVEWMYSEVYAGFASVFTCPLIWSSPVEPNALVLMLLNEHPNAYTPSLLTSTTNPPISFWRRVAEQLRFLHVKFHRWLLSDKEKAVFNRAFASAISKRGGSLPPFELIKYNGSLVLGNSHFSTGQALRLPLNYIQIAGYHIDDKREPLSKNLQKIMDSATKGVIYLSVGSIFRGTLPDDVTTLILDVFKKMNRTVIWQYEGSLKAPKNVHVFQRVPQQSILAHSNCTLFITNGETPSIVEAMHFGVPILSISKFQSQLTNVDGAVIKGFAKKVDVLNVATLKATIDDLLMNAKYREKVKELSDIYHDRLISPGKELVFWIQHVVGTKGALHLRSPVFVPWYDAVYLELVIVILIPVLLLCVLIVYLLRRRKEDHDLGFKKYI